MVAAHHTLPDLDALDPDALKALILSQQEKIFSQREQLVSKDEQLASRDTEIEHLKLLIAKLRRMQFGRTSEKLDRQIEQLELRLDELAGDASGEHSGFAHTGRGCAGCKHRLEASAAAAAGASAARECGTYSAEAEQLARTAAAS